MPSPHFSAAESCQKRQQFHCSIRRKNIEAVQKTRRTLLIRQERAEQQNREDLELYDSIIRQPDQLMQHGPQYLQMLKEILQSPHSYRYTTSLPDVLNSILKFQAHRPLPILQQPKSIQQQPQPIQQQPQPIQQQLQQRMLVMDCIALIYYETVIPFYEITREVVKMANSQLLGSFGMHMGKGEGLRIRCLICLENVTSCDLPEVLSAVMDEGVLQSLEDLLEQFPLTNHEKEHVMGIYGNTLDYLLPQQGYTYHTIFLACIEENYNREVLQKAVQTLILMYTSGYTHLDFIDLTETLLHNVLKFGAYLNKIEKLLCCLAKHLASTLEHPEEHPNMELPPVVTLLIEILEETAYIGNGKGQTVNVVGDASELILTHSLLFQILDSSEFYEGEPLLIKRVGLVQQMFDFWVEMEDCSEDAIELRMLEFTEIWSQEPSIIRSLAATEQGRNSQLAATEQDRNSQLVSPLNAQGRNSLSAATWEIVLEFLKCCTLESSQKICAFCGILCNPVFVGVVLASYTDVLVQKLQGCYFFHDSSGTVKKLASQAINTFQSEMN